MRINTVIYSVQIDLRMIYFFVEGGAPSSIGPWTSKDHY